MSALLGFGAVPRKWASLLIAVPTAVWLLADWRWRRRDPVAPGLTTTALALAAQMLIAVAISLVIGRIVHRRAKVA